MTKYISSKSLIDCIEEHRGVAKNCSPGVKYLSDLLHSQFCDIVKMVEKHDSVELVRCKGCQYAWPEGDGYCCTNAEGMDVNAHLSGEEYCSCGKPRQSEPS